MVTQKYLTYGRLWEPVYADNNIPYFEEYFNGGGRHLGKAPSAEARLWQAEDGNIAIFIANYVDTEVEFSYTLNPEKYGLDAENYHLMEIKPEGNTEISLSGKTIARTEVLAPGKVKVIEFIPVKQATSKINP